MAAGKAVDVMRPAESLMPAKRPPFNAAMLGQSPLRPPFLPSTVLPGKGAPDLDYLINGKAPRQLNGSSGSEVGA